MDEKEIGQLAEIIETEVPVQEMIINGQRQVMTDKGIALACPNCKNIFQTFQQGATRLDILNHLSSDNEQELNAYIYCQKCGQKIKFMRPAAIDNKE